MARALWKGAIAFGLVNIPVELHPAEERKAFKFAMLDERDLSPVGYKRYNKQSGKEVEWEHIVKGYEYEKDQYVVLSDEDFRRANVKATQTIDIRAFVHRDEIPVEYFETPYYLASSGRGEKVYALLRETLKDAGCVAVAQVVIRTRQHLAAVVPDERALMLLTLRYHDELRPPIGLDLPPASVKAAGVSAKEIALAKRLVDDMTERWDASAFKDTYHDDLMARVRQKIKLGQTKEITKPDKHEEAVPRSAQIIDLADLLKQSLGKGAGARKSEASGAHKSAAAHEKAPAKSDRKGLHVVAGKARAPKRPTKIAAAAATAARRKRA